MRWLSRGLSAAAPAVATLLATRLFRTPSRPRQPRRELEWARGSREFEVETPAGAVAARRWGKEGPTVMLVHGWAGRGLQLGAFVAPLRELGLQVVAYDAPAHGASPGRLSSLPELRSTVIEMARVVGPLHGVVAHSLGATAALWAVREGQLDAARFALLAPAADLDAIADRYADQTWFSRAVVARMQARFERELGFKWSEINGSTLGGALHQPALVVHDAFDREVPCSEGRVVAEAAADAQYVRSEGLGHRRLLRDYAVTGVTARFLADSRLPEVASFQAPPAICVEPGAPRLSEPAA